MVLCPELGGGEGKTALIDQRAVAAGNNRATIAAQNPCKRAPGAGVAVDSVAYSGYVPDCP